LVRSLRNPINLLILILAAVLVTACASTYTSGWKDPSYQTLPAKIMVVGVGKNPLSRRLLEDEFVLQSKSRGTDAFASYTVLQGDPTAIAKKVAELGADAVLITSLVRQLQIPIFSTWLKHCLAFSVPVTSASVWKPVKTVQPSLW
jgi:hypothetical protein